MQVLNIKKMGKVGVVAIATVLSGCAQIPEAVAQSYEIDAGHTHISFTVNRFGFADTLGIFPVSKGEITLDVDHPENSSVQASVSTADVWTGLAARDEAVRSKAWLNTDEFDTITFTSTSVNLDHNNDKHAAVLGDLTIWGKSVPVSFDVTLNQMGPDRTARGREAVGFSMDAMIKRTDFGHMTALKFVGDDVHIHIETVAHLKAE